MMTVTSRRNSRRRMHCHTSQSTDRARSPLIVALRSAKSPGLEVPMAGVAAGCPECEPGDLALTAAYERVRIGAAETKWKPNGNIACLCDVTVNLSSLI